MSQFDVYFNKNPRTKKYFPYLVDIQNSVISDIATRVVIPLGYANLFANEYMDKLSPKIEYDDEKLILLTPQLASIPAKTLNNPIGTIEYLRDEIIGSLDFAFTDI